MKDLRNARLTARVIGEAILSHIKPRIKHLILHVTNRCNMRCKHCFVDCEDSRQELTLDEIGRLSQRLPDLLWLDIGGGEPLLRDDLEEIVSLFRFREVSIPTNGWDTERIVERLKRIHQMTSGKLIVTLSLEGMAKTHDEIRHPTSFERTVQTFKKLKGVDGIRLKFNTVLCEKNCDEIVELVNFVKRLGPDYHSILLLRGKARDPAMRLPSVDRIEAVGKRIERIQQGYGYGRTGLLSRIQRNYQAYKRDLTLRTLREKRQVIPCLAGVSHLVVWSEGSVSPCELLPAVGKLREKDLGELLNGPDMKRAVSCIAKGECFCTHDCNMIENILFNPRSYLKLLVGGVQRG